MDDGVDRRLARPRPPGLRISGHELRPGDTTQSTPVVNLTHQQSPCVPSRSEGSVEIQPLGVAVDKR